LTGNFATLAGRLREVAAALDGREEIGDACEPGRQFSRRQLLANAAIAASRVGS
jgi:hypothetical protein